MSVPQELANELGVEHESIEPISWLIGRWRSERATGQYPTHATFQYGEEIEFTSLGQPLLNYTMHSFYPEKLIPIHLEKGFLRIKPGTNKLAFMIAHNLGYCTVEEGEVSGKEIILESVNVERMTFVRNPEVLKTKRIIRLVGANLEQKVFMETSNTPLTVHIIVTYRKVN